MLSTKFEDWSLIWKTANYVTG